MNKELKVGDTFWEYNKHMKALIPRIVHSQNHIEYFKKHYLDFTFYSVEEALNYRSEAKTPYIETNKLKF